MPRLHIIYNYDGWAHHHRAAALARHAPSDFSVTAAALYTPADLDVAAGRFTGPWDLDVALGAQEPDVLFLLLGFAAVPVRERMRENGWKCPFVISWNNGWPHRSEALPAARRAADAVVFTNRNYRERVGRPPGSHVAVNGVDLETFRARNPIDARAPQVLWVGSEVHRRRKGYDHYLVSLRERLAAGGIPCKLMLVDSRGAAKRTLAEMATWYDAGTVYVCASETEGTPNPALEAAACGCTVVSTRVGNMVDLIRHGENGYLVDREEDDLFAAVMAAVRDYPRLARAMQRDIAAWGWERRAPVFFDLFRSVLRDRRVDLRASPVGPGNVRTQ